MDGTVEQELDLAELREIAKERIGEVLSDVGRLEELVGLGTIGAVYRASRPTGESVAVKIMHEHIKSNDSLRDRFLREATILDQADHPSAVEVYGTGESNDGEAYFVMEYLDGEELRALQQRADRIPVAQTLRIAEQSLDCLQAYHEAGVLHRDLKPANLFVTREGVVKLLDFGLARFRTGQRDPTQAGTAMGTPAYMAPEQALGHQDKIDERTDVFGLGAVMYRLLSGRTIHDIESVQATLVQAATSQPDPLQTHAPDVPEAVAEIVDRAVAREREDRYQSAAEMRDAVREAIEVVPEVSGAESSPESVEPPESEADASAGEVERGGAESEAGSDVESDAESDAESNRGDTSSDDFLPADSPRLGAFGGTDSPSSSPELAADGGEPDPDATRSSTREGVAPGESGGLRVEQPDEATGGEPGTDLGEPMVDDESAASAGETREESSPVAAPDDDPSIIVEADELEGLLDEEEDDDGDEPPAAETESLDPTPPDLTPELERMLASVRRDGAGGEFLRAMNEVLEQLHEARTEGVRRVTWRIHPHAFEADDGTRHRFDDELADLPPALQQAGFHRLMVETSIDEEALSTFVQWLATDPRASLPGEDDLATRFRELELQSVGAGIYPVFRWDDRGDAPPPEADAHADLVDRAVGYLHGARGTWQGLETLADEGDWAGDSTRQASPRASISSRLVSHADDFLRTPKGVLSLEVASVLDEAITAEDRAGARRIGAVLAAIWRDDGSSFPRPSRTIRELIASYLDRELGRRTIEVIGTACRHLPNTDARRAFVATAIEGVDVERLIEVVDRSFGDEAERDKFARVLADIAEEFPASRRAEIIATYEFGDDFTRRILRPYRQRFQVSEGGNIEARDDDEQAEAGPDSEGDEGEAEQTIDWRRAFAGEVYRLFRVAVFEETEPDRRDEFTRAFHRRVRKLLELASNRLTVIFAEDRILVDGLPLRGSTSSYEALWSVAEFLDPFDCNAITVEGDLEAGDVEALVDLLDELAGDEAPSEPPLEPSPRVRLHRADPADRLGMVDPLVGDEPIETRMGRYYAGCVTTLRQFLRTTPAERGEWLSTLKRMSQTWVRLSRRSRGATLALTGLRGDDTSPGRDAARIVLDSTLLAVSMARRLTGRTETLRRIGFGALCADFDLRTDDDSTLRWHSAAECASALLANARTDDATLRRAVGVFEIGRLFDNHPEELPYRESIKPRVETLLVGIAREYVARSAGIGAEAGASPRAIVESISEGKTLRVERYLLHLLVDTLGLFTRGMPVKLSSGWRGVVLASNDHVTDFHLPEVRLVRNPDGERVSSFDLDLAEAIEKSEGYGYVVRRLEDVDDEEASNIEDSMTDSMREG